jgi:hypothetical protein
MTVLDSLMTRSSSPTETLRIVSVQETVYTVTYGDIVCGIMGKRHSIIEMFALVRCREALVDVCYHCFGKTYWFHLHRWSSARRMPELVDV